MELAIKKEPIEEDSPDHPQEWDSFEEIHIKNEVCDEKETPESDLIEPVVECQETIYLIEKYDHQAVEETQFVLVDDAMGSNITPHESNAGSPQYPDLNSAVPRYSHNHKLLKEKDVDIKTCDFCKKTFKTEGSKNLHLRMQHCEFTMNCAMCDYKTYQRKYLISHIENRHFYELKIPYICKICDKQLFNKILLKKHIKNIHNDPKEFTNSSFINKSDLKSHYSGTNSIPNRTNFIDLKSLQCMVCLKTFIKESDLIVHEMVHRQNPYLNCKFCSKTCRNEQDLDNHVTKKHVINNKTTGFCCEKCKKSFRSNIQLRMHTTTHAGMYMFAKH